MATKARPPQDNKKKFRDDLKYSYREFKEKSKTLCEKQLLFFLGISRTLVLLSVLITYTLTTYLVFFDIRFHDHRSNHAILLHICDAVYFIDFIMRVAFEEIHLFRYKFQPEGCCQDPCQKAWKWFTSLLEITSLLPIEYIAYFWKDVQSEKWLLTFASMRLVRVYRTRYIYFWHSRQKERSCIAMPGRAWNMATATLILFGITIYHAVACLWYYLNCSPIMNNTTPPVCSFWMQRYYNYVNDLGQKGTHPFYKHIDKSKIDPFGHYIGCFLWSVMTIRSSGNFYYPPSTHTEMIYNIGFFAFTFAMQFFILLLSINTVIASDMPRLLFYTELKGVNRFLRYLNLHRIILSDVLGLFDSVWNRRRVFTDRGIKHLLTPCLEQSLCLEKASPILYASELLQTFTRTALEALAPSVEFKNYFAGEYILRPYSQGNEMKFLSSGYAQLIEPDLNKRIITFTCGSLFGEINIICPTFRRFGVQAVTDCEAMVVSFQAVNEILKIDRAMRRQMQIIILRRLDFAWSPVDNHKHKNLDSQGENSPASRQSSWASIKSALKEKEEKKEEEEEEEEEEEDYEEDEEGRINQEPMKKKVDIHLSRYVSLLAYRRHLRETQFDGNQYNNFDSDMAAELKPYLRNRAANANYHFAKEVWTSRYNLGIWKGCAISKDTLFYQAWSTFTFFYIIINTIWLMISILNYDSSNETLVMVINMVTDVVYTMDAALTFFVFRDPWEVTSKADIIQYTFHFHIELRNPKSWFDIIAIFPIWCFSPRHPMPQWMRFNVLFKFFTIFFKVHELEQAITINIVTTRVIKHVTNFFGFIMIAAFTATIFRCAGDGYRQCVMEPSQKVARRYNLNKQGESILGLFMYWAVCVVFGIGFKDIHNRTHESEFYIVAYLVGFALLIYCWAELISTYVEMSEVKIKYEKARAWMREYLDSQYASRDLMKAVDDFLINQWDCWRGIESSKKTEEKSGYLAIGHSAYDELIVQAVVDTIYNVPLFENMEPNMVREFSVIAKLISVGPRKVIIHYGDGISRLYIIRRGIVEVTVISGISCPVVQKLGPGSCLGFGEMAFKIPSIAHIRSISDVELISIDASAFFRIFETSRSFSRVWTRFIKSKTNMMAYKRFLTPKGYTPIVRYRDNAHHDKIPLVPALNFFLSPSSMYKKKNVVNPKWEEPWKKANWFIRCLKPFTLKMSIHPFKIGEQIWETLRFLIVYITLFVIPIGEAFPCFREEVIAVYYLSDIISLLDMFFRCYTAYYNPKLNIHPSKTIPHYLTSSFITDLIGGPIFYYFYIFCLRCTTIDFQEGVVAYCLKLNRIVLIYHIFGYHRQFTKDVWAPSEWIKVLKVVPIVVFFLHLVACTFAVRGCPSLNCPYQYPRCQKRTWITNSAFHNGHPIWAGNGSVATDLEIYAAAFYYSATTSSGCTFGDFAAVTSYERIFIAIILFIYIIGIAFVMARVVSSQSLKHFNLVTFQKQIHNLMEFMVQSGVDYHLKASILAYYEHQWHHCKGDEPREHFLALYPALREEVGFQIYTNAFECIIELQGSCEGFLRGLCDISTPQFIPMGQYIFREHDVADTFSLIKSGMTLCSKEAYLGTRIKALGVLGTFGRFYEYTAKAIDNIELLTFCKKDFVKLAIVFPEEYKNMRESMKRDRKEPYNKDEKGNVIGKSEKSIPLKRTMSDLTPLTANKQDKFMDTSSTHNLHFVGVEALLDPTLDEPLAIAAQPLDEFDQDFDEPQFDYQALYRGFVLHQDNTMTILIYQLYFIGALGSVLIVPYQAAFKNFERYIFLLSYICDLIYVTKMIVSFFVTSINDDGIIVADRSDIGVRYFGHYNGFTFDLMTIFPFEVLAPTQWGKTDLLYMLCICKLNRILRLKHVWEFFNPEDYNSGYNVKLTKLRFWRIIIMTLVYVHWMACLLQFWTLYDCPLNELKKGDWHKCMMEMKNVTWLGTKSDDKFLDHIYVYTLYFVVTTFTATAFGDVRAMSPFEMVFISILAISSKAWLALALSDSVRTVQLYMDPKATFALAVSESLADYKYDGISDYTLQRITQHLETIWIFNRGMLLPRMVKILPSGLKKDLMFFLYEKHLMKSYLFYNLPENFCRSLSMVFERMIVVQGEVIIKSGQIGDRMYFINCGIVGFRKTYPIRQERGYYKTNEGRVSYPRHFGEENAILGNRRYSCSYIAETDVELLYIDYEKLKRTFEPFFKDVQKIIMKRFEKVYKLRRGGPEPPTKDLKTQMEDDLTPFKE